MIIDNTVFKIVNDKVTAERMTLPFDMVPRNSKGRKTTTMKKVVLPSGKIILKEVILYKGDEWIYKDMLS